MWYRQTVFTANIYVFGFYFFVSVWSHLPIAQFHNHYIYPLTPSPAHLLPLTGSVHRAVNGELGRWKNIWAYPSVPVNLQPWAARFGHRYDPQPVKRSSE